MPKKAPNKPDAKSRKRVANRKIKTRSGPRDPRGRLTKAGELIVQVSEVVVACETLRNWAISLWKQAMMFNS